MKIKKTSNKIILFSIILNFSQYSYTNSIHSFYIKCIINHNEENFCEIDIKNYLQENVFHKSFVEKNPKIIHVLENDKFFEVRLLSPLIIDGKKVLKTGILTKISKSNNEVYSIKVHEKLLTFKKEETEIFLDSVSSFLGKGIELMIRSIINKDCIIEKNVCNNSSYLIEFKDTFRHNYVIFKDDSNNKMLILTKNKNPEDVWEEGTKKIINNNAYENKQEKEDLGKLKEFYLSLRKSTEASMSNTELLILAEYYSDSMRECVKEILEGRIILD